MERRNRLHPEKLNRRKEIVEHPFGTMKRSMNQGYFLIRGLENVKTHRHMLELPAGEPFSNRNLPWWDSIPVSPVEKILLRHYLDILDHLKPLIGQLNAQIASLSASPEWRDFMTFVLQIPGFGVTLGLTILSFIGDISRFGSPHKLVGYSSLGVSVHASGETFRQGRITKSGCRDLRTALIEAAWAAVDFDPTGKVNSIGFPSASSREKPSSPSPDACWWSCGISFPSGSRIGTLRMKRSPQK